MTKILTFCGKKQSGKSSSAKFLTGYVLRDLNKADPTRGIKFFDVNDEGDLIVNTRFTNAEGQEEEANGVCDIYRKDLDFINYAMYGIWPYVKIYSFADRLKQALEVIFNIPQEILYGTNEQKNGISHIKWDDVPFNPEGKTGFMTFREVAQYFGTEICRKMYDECWIQAVYNDILNEEPPFAIIDDARFPNEVEFMKSKGSAVIKLCRDAYGDKHASEVALDNMPDSDFDAVIHNEAMTMKEKNEAVLTEVFRLGIFEGRV